MQSEALIGTLRRIPLFEGLSDDELRWVVEHSLSWLHQFRRLRIRNERSSERFYALAMLACAVICFNTLQQPP